MGDLLYPLGTLAFFGLMLGYVRAIRGLLKDVWGASYAD
jgi:hypothetical protein